MARITDQDDAALAPPRQRVAFDHWTDASPETAGHAQTACELYYKACENYRIGQHAIFVDDHPDKIFLHNKLLESFQGCIRTADYPIERVEIDWDGVPANLGSVAIGSIPNYLINRYWTWQQSGRNRIWGEIVPFWTMAFLGVVLSTLAVAYADRQWGTPLTIAIAQLSGFGVLWFARFLILDKVMWRVVHDHLDADADGDLGSNGDGTTAAATVDHGSAVETELGVSNGNGQHEDTQSPARAGDAPPG
jgi:putative flippase GtrA